MTSPCPRPEEQWRSHQAPSKNLIIKVLSQKDFDITEPLRIKCKLNNYSIVLSMNLCSIFLISWFKKGVYSSTLVAEKRKLAKILSLWSKMLKLVVFYFYLFLLHFLNLYFGFYLELKPNIIVNVFIFCARAKTCIKLKLW